ncbi:MAG: hypothetical protein ACYDC2_08980 [Solirubrobacteraceae bacterium]
MIGAIGKLLRFASVGICVLVALSFLIFAVDQAKSASGEQQTALREGTERGSTVPGSKRHKNSFHKAVDEAAETFTSPFSEIVTASQSEWAEQGVKLLLALLVYGFGLGYIARVFRVRA